MSRPEPDDLFTARDCELRNRTDIDRATTEMHARLAHPAYADWQISDDRDDCPPHGIPRPVRGGL